MILRSHAKRIRWLFGECAHVVSQEDGSVVREEGAMTCHELIPTSHHLAPSSSISMVFRTRNKSHRSIS